MMSLVEQRLTGDGKKIYQALHKLTEQILCCLNSNGIGSADAWSLYTAPYFRTINYAKMDAVIVADARRGQSVTGKRWFCCVIVANDQHSEKALRHVVDQADDFMTRNGLGHNDCKTLAAIWHHTGPDFDCQLHLFYWAEQELS
ncbi:MAG: hypothetical protein PHO91_00730 [Patescibacteria group bacterium]|nr:hypothetical protein [Patescibacteria group bacterium]